jgi:putative transposase
MSAARNLVPFQLPGEAAGAAMLPALPAGRTGATGDAPARAALIDSADQEQAEERLAIIQPLLDFDADPHRFAKSKSQLVRSICAERGIGRATLFRWQEAYREGGLPALADRQRSDKGRSRYFEANPRAAWVAAYLHLECRQSYRAVFEELSRRAGELELAELPHYDTVRSWLASVPPSLRAYALKGRREYTERCAPYLSRGYTDVEPNRIWVSDHAIHDVEVMNDCFPEAEWGMPIRLRFTCLLDFRARYVTGASWCWEGSSRSIATAMRRALLRYEPCEGFYCDNGKDYLKVAKGAVPAYLVDPSAIAGWHQRELVHIERTGILARLGIRVTHCIVHHPQSKHVERFFRTMHEQFDRRWHHHYTAGAPHLRPDATTAAMMLHRKLMKRGKAANSTHPPASVFIALATEWIEEYHNRPHSGRGMDGATPAEIFAMRPEGIVRADSDALALLLEEHDRRKVRECSVEIGRRRYIGFDQESLHTLHQLNDTSVVVAYDANDPDAVAILDDAGHLLTWAKAESYLRMDPADPETQAAIAQSMADRRHLEKETRNTLAVISRTARSLGAKTPVESMAERAAIIPAVESLLTHRTPKPKPSADAQAPASAAEIAANFWRS